MFKKKRKRKNVSSRTQLASKNQKPLTLPRPKRSTTPLISPSTVILPWFLNTGCARFLWPMPRLLPNFSHRVDERGRLLKKEKRPLLTPISVIKSRSSPRSRDRNFSREKVIEACSQGPPGVAEVDERTLQVSDTAGFARWKSNRSKIVSETCARFRSS